MRVFLMASALVLAACGDSRGTATPAASPPPTSAPTPPGTPAPVPTPTPSSEIPPIASLTNGVWMKGDIHIHSRHSNDSTNNPVAKIIALGETVGMDFLGITDHDNHVDGDVAGHTWADPEFTSRSLLLLYGAEWTTHRGHGTPLSAKPYDHKRFYDVRDARDSEVAKVKKALGIHLSANHPGNTDHFGFSYDLVDSMEIWSSSIWTTNATAVGASSVGIWDDMLKSGRKISARGGSDSHHGYPDTPGNDADPNNIQAGGNNIGTPTTWVYGTARTAQAVIDALTAGRASVTVNPNAPRIEFTADLDGNGTADLMMGDNVKATGRAVTFTVKLVGTVVPAGVYTVSVVKDGGTFGSYRATGLAPSVSFTDTPDATARSYYRVQVEGPAPASTQVPGAAALSGNMLGLTNPIHFNFDPAF